MLLVVEFGVPVDEGEDYDGHDEQGGVPVRTSFEKITLYLEFYKN